MFYGNNPQVDGTNDSHLLSLQSIIISMVSNLATLAVAFMAFTACAAKNKEPMFSIYKGDSCKESMPGTPVTMKGMVGDSGCFGFCLNVTGTFGSFEVSGTAEDLVQTSIYGFAGHGCANSYTIGRGYFDYKMDVEEYEAYVRAANYGCQAMNLIPDASGNSSVQIYRGNCDRYRASKR